MTGATVLSVGANRQSATSCSYRQDRRFMPVTVYQFLKGTGGMMATSSPLSRSTMSSSNFTFWIEEALCDWPLVCVFHTSCNFKKPPAATTLLTRFQEVNSSVSLLARLRSQRKLGRRCVLTLCITQEVARGWSFLKSISIFKEIF